MSRDIPRSISSAALNPLIYRFCAQRVRDVLTTDICYCFVYGDQIKFIMGLHLCCSNVDLEVNTSEQLGSILRRDG